HLDGIELESVGEQIHHPLGLDVEMAARVAAVGAGQALVGHHDAGVHLEMLEAIGPDVIADGAEAAAGLRAADVATHVVEPAVAHAEHGPVAPRTQLASGYPIGAARRREAV